MLIGSTSRTSTPSGTELVCSEFDTEAPPKPPLFWPLELGIPSFSCDAKEESWKTKPQQLKKETEHSTEDQAFIDAPKVRFH